MADLRVKNISTSPVDDIPPGKEGRVRDTVAVRALITGGVLAALDPLPPEPPPKTLSKAQRGAPRDLPHNPPYVDPERRAPTIEEGMGMLAEIRRGHQRLAESENLVRERDARIKELEETLRDKDVRNVALDELVRERDAKIAGLEEEIAALKSKTKKKADDSPPKE